MSEGWHPLAVALLGGIEHTTVTENVGFSPEVLSQVRASLPDDDQQRRRVIIDLTALMLEFRQAGFERGAREVQTLLNEAMAPIFRQLAPEPRREFSPVVVPRRTEPALPARSGVSLRGKSPGPSGKE